MCCKCFSYFSFKKVKSDQKGYGRCIKSRGKDIRKWNDKCIFKFKVEK